eukprot:jgi/Galph1/3700/GphlegSOOS_G2314.1
MPSCSKRSRVDCEPSVEFFLKKQNPVLKLKEKAQSKELKPPLGLTNLGNTCYINAVIQVLYHLESFRTLVKSESFRLFVAEGSSSNKDIKKDCYILRSLQELFIELEMAERESKETCLSPVNFLMHLRSYGGELFNFQQQDAHEFFRFLLESIYKVCSSEEYQICNMQNSEMEASYISRGLNPIQYLFEGKGVTKTRCLECEQCSSNEEFFWDFSLPVCAQHSISWALSECCKREILASANKYACQHCMTYTEAERYWSFVRLPPILVFQFKLFSQNMNMNRKVNTVVPFPTELKMGRWCDVSCDHADRRYRLHAVIIHQGLRLGEGHYYAFVNIDGKDSSRLGETPNNFASSGFRVWCCLDDAESFFLSEEDLTSLLFKACSSAATPYVLIYLEECNIQQDC